MTISPELLQHLACPRDRQPLFEDGSWLCCAARHRYPIVEDVPVLLLDDVAQTIELAHASLAEARSVMAGDTSQAPYFVRTLGLSDEQRRGVLAARDLSIDPAASFLVGATNGHLYSDLVGRLSEYPIPELRVVPNPGYRFLDIGCSWGRWTIAAARMGFEAFGLDPSLGAALAAKRIARTLGVRVHCVVGDARFMPFRDATFHQVFSYSVLQHMSVDDVVTVLGQARRVTQTRGHVLIQMPNRLGIRSLYHQARRRFRTGRHFEVRYWALADLLRVFESEIGPAQLSVDGFFGLGIQRTDLHMMSPRGRAVITASDILRATSLKVPLLGRLADSVYVNAVVAARGGD